MPEPDHRLAVYEVLRDAKPVAVRCKDFWRRGISNVHAHIESLRFEGHVVQQVQIGENREWGWRLERDVWEGQPTTGTDADGGLEDSTTTVRSTGKSGTEGALPGPLQELLEPHEPEGLLRA